MPRKATPAPEPLPPGPTRLEVRVNDKIVFLQRVYSYSIDQENEQFAVYGSLKPVETPAAEPPVEPVGDA